MSLGYAIVWPAQLKNQLKVVKLVKGVLSNPNPKHGKTLNETTAELVVNFYMSDEDSRMMPGKKIVYQSERKASNPKTKKISFGLSQKMYQLFKEKCPNNRIGFSKLLN